MTKKQDIDRAIRATYIDSGRSSAPREHRNERIAALRAEHPEWSKDTQNEDNALQWRFCKADASIGYGSTHGAIEAMALAGVSVRGCATGDGRMVNRGIVRLGIEDEEGPARKMRKIDGYLAKLDERSRTVLFLAYGPQEYTREIVDRFGRWCGVLLVTKEAEARHAEYVETLGAQNARRCPEMRTQPLGLGQWLTERATHVEIARAKLEAEALVYEAWNKWADARGRRRTGVSHRSDEDALAALDERERAAGR